MNACSYHSHKLITTKFQVLPQVAKQGYSSEGSGEGSLTAGHSQSSSRSGKAVKTTPLFSGLLIESVDFFLFLFLILLPCDSSLPCLNYFLFAFGAERRLAGECWVCSETWGGELGKMDGNTSCTAFQGVYGAWQQTLMASVLRVFVSAGNPL